MKKTIGLHLFIELLWLILAIIAALIVNHKLFYTIKEEFLYPLLAYSFLAFTYFRIALFTKENIFLKHIVARFLLFMINIPLFFGIIIQLQDFFYLFDHYNIEQFLIPGILNGGDDTLSIYHHFRGILIASAVSSLILILILEFKLARYILNYFR